MQRVLLRTGPPLVTYHAFAFKKYVHRYLGQAQCLFNRRFDLRSILFVRSTLHSCIRGKGSPVAVRHGPFIERTTQGVPSVVAAHVER